MVVWRLRRGALLLCSGVFFVFVFISWSLKHDEHLNRNIYSEAQNMRAQQDTSNTKKASEVIDNTLSMSTTCKPVDLVMDVAAVVCGDRLDEAMSMVKSILIFTKHQLHFHIVAEQELQGNLKMRFENFPPSARQHFDYTVYNLSYPANEDKVTWKKLFKTCASQRLFLMNFIKRDKILYLDTDVLLVSPLEYLWKHFSNFNKTHLAALTPEGEVPSLNWYRRFSRHPYYGKLGLNSGVMLMNLKKLKEIDFEKKIIAIYRQYNLVTPWGDQDLLNIFFHQYPELIYVYPCEWNYRPDHCMYQNNCNTALQNGIYVIHGNRGVFHNTKQPTFQLIYNIIKDYKFGENIKSKIIERALHESKSISDRYCKLMTKSFLKNMQGVG